MFRATEHPDSVQNTMSFLSGVTVGNQNGEKLDAAQATEGKVVALYFSAMWCGSCRQFLPKLKKFFDAVKKAGKPLEIILVSRDKADEDLEEYFKEHNGDWLHLFFGDEKIQEYLAHFEVPTIPALRVIRPDGTVAVKDARFEVQDKGAEDPVALFDSWQAAVNSK